MQDSGPINININTSNTQTSVPQIAPGQMAQLRFVGASQKTNEKGNILSFSYELAQPVGKLGGGTINPGDFGAKIFENISLYGKDTAAGEIPTWAAQRIAERLDALLGTGDPGNAKGKPQRPDFGPAVIPQLIGKVMFAKFKARKDDPNQSEIERVFFPGDVAA